jgi:hypothetical protein
LTAQVIDIAQGGPICERVGSKVFGPLHHHRLYFNWKV